MDRFRRSSPPPGTQLPPRRAIQAAALDNAASASGARRKPGIGRAAESFQNKFLAQFRSRRRGEGECDGSSPFLEAFFRLPSELHIQILSTLTIADILSFRLACRSTHDLVTASSAPLVRYWVKHRLGSLHVKLYPPPPPNEADLRYLLAMRRRHIASIRLTRELSKFVLRDTLKHTSQRQKELWDSVYEKMIPLVFAVGYFLEQHRRAILERDLGKYRPECNIGYDICTTGPLTDTDRASMKRMDPILRLQYFYMFCFIVQVLSRKLRPPTYAGSVEKFVRGWTARAACSEDIAFILILGGTSQVAKLLSCRNYTERQRQLHNFILKLSPYENRNWKQRWKDLGVTSPALLDDIPCTSIGITRLDQIWEPLIREKMVPGCREYTDAQKAKYFEVRASKTYVNELMGYDILRGRPAGGDESDGEHVEDM